jgi:hypothetical protein
VNLPSGSSPGPRHDGPGTASSGAEDPDEHDGRDAETDEADRERTEPAAHQHPDGYEPL